MNAIPALGRFRATILVAAAAVGLCGVPDLIDSAQSWIVHLGNVAAPLAGGDARRLRRASSARRIDVSALFDPNGPYRYLNGVNVAAVAAIAVGVGALLRALARRG